VPAVDEDGREDRDVPRRLNALAVIVEVPAVRILSVKKHTLSVQKPKVMDYKNE
jgi:hypothetical protein